MTLPTIVVSAVAEQRRVDVVAGCRDEREQGACHDPGHRQREGDLAHRGERVRVQVTRRLHQARVDPLQRGVDRQDHERQEVVGDPDDHGRRGVDDVVLRTHQVQELQRGDHPALVGQDLLPGDGPQQEADEERRDHQHQQQVAPPPGLERDRVGQRVGDGERQHGGDERVQERAAERRGVLAERLGVVGERERLRVDADLGALRPGLRGRREQRDERHEEEDRQPGHAGQQQEVRRAAEPAGPGGRRSGRRRCPRPPTAAAHRARCPAPRSCQPTGTGVTPSSCSTPALTSPLPSRANV